MHSTPPPPESQALAPSLDHGCRNSGPRQDQARDDKGDEPVQVRRGSEIWGLGVRARLGGLCRGDQPECLGGSSLFAVDMVHGSLRSENAQRTSQGLACLMLIFSAAPNCEITAYRSVMSENYSARNIGALLHGCIR